MGIHFEVSFRFVIQHQNDECIQNVRTGLKKKKKNSVDFRFN